MIEFTYRIRELIADWIAPAPPDNFRCEECEDEGTEQGCPECGKIDLRIDQDREDMQAWKEQQALKERKP